MAVLKSIDTDGSGVVNYTGNGILLFFYRIFGCYYREECIYEIGKTILSF